MYQSMSNTYFEAADIDGANDWHKCYFIAIPLSMSLISALFIMNWMGAWNAYGGAIIYHPKIPTFAAGIYLFQLQMRYGARADILYAACFIACIPPLILFISFNKMLLNNVSLGGIKE
jgi:ABC-type glycerol-3-phosphate transport system permease component